MFQISAAIAHALRNNFQFKIPVRSHDPRIWPVYFTHLPRLPIKAKLSKYKEREFYYQPIPPRDNICLSGYFQSELYFKDFRGEVLTAFKFPTEPLKGYVSIHVRRGDYVTQFPDKHPPVTEEYLIKAINHFPNHKFLVFSDDMKWCKEHLLGQQFEFSEGKRPLEDLHLMSQCEHNIISNSSFSWWSAWGNRNPNKIVIAPRVWFGKGNDHLSTETLIPESWIRI